MIAAGASWQVASMAGRLRSGGRKSVRARRAEMWRRRREADAAGPDASRDKDAADDG